ncbi:hypothetical protein [Saccharopolyspora shandongensis]|uniref:hypothetical protein n=1 Tax=Saccharopolyspora shandongensis TaxID=418495 RepID=UPI0033EF5056
MIDEGGLAQFRRWVLEVLDLVSADHVLQAEYMRVSRVGADEIILQLDDVMYVARARLHDGSLTQDEFLLLQSVDEVICSANEFESICDEIALKESASWRELRAAARLARSELEQSWR